VTEACNFREVRLLFMKGNMAYFRNKLGDIYNEEAKREREVMAR
jgi:hypothetical protein